MRQRIRALSEVPPLLRSYAGRERLRNEANLRLWPVAAPLARFYRDTVLRETPVIAVVGSQGKSTTVRAVRAALDLDVASWQDENCGVEIATGLVAGRRGVPVVLEVGIGARGQMESYARNVRPSAVVVTSIGTEHHGSLGSREDIRAEKARMVESLAPSATVFLNADDENVAWMGGRTRARRVTFGFSSGADVRAVDVRLDWPRGMTFTLLAGGEGVRTRTRLVSRELLRAVLSAAAVARSLGVPLREALARLEALSPTPRRLQPRRLSSGAWLLRDEYKSTLETIESALTVMEEIDTPARKFVVLGEVSEPPGSQGPIYRALGERIARFAHAAVFVGGNFQRYAAGARRGGLPPERIVDAERSWRSASDYLRRELREGDVALVKGRDTQRLDRISLSLLGLPVACPLTECELLDCAPCPNLGPAGRSSSIERS